MTQRALTCSIALDELDAWGIPQGFLSNPLTDAQKSIFKDNMGLSQSAALQLPADLLKAGETVAGYSQIYADSSAIVFLSDSTGIQPSQTECGPYVLAQQIASKRPNSAVLVKFWNDSNQDYDGWNFLTANEQRYVNMTTNDGQARTRTMQQADIGAFTNLDLRVDIAPTSWTPASSAGVVGQWGGSGQKNHRLLIRSDGKLELDFSLDGTAVIGPTSSVATGFAAGVRKEVRVTRNASTGATNFYTRDPGTTAWTQLGSANVSSTSGALATVVRDYELGGTGGSFTLPGKYYAVEYRADIGDSFKIVNPQTIEQWYGNEDKTPMAGAPTVYIWVGGKSGADAAYLTDATRGPKLVPPIWLPTLGFVNDSHNESTSLSRTSFFTLLDGFKTLFSNQCPGSITVPMTQNARADAVAEPHRRKQNWIRMWAFRNSLPCVDLFLAWLKDSAGIEANLQPDKLHPNTRGGTLWGTTAAKSVIP